MKKILFTGGDGKLCSEFKKLNNSNFIFLNKKELDITNCDSIDNVFKKYEFDYLLHSAALTRPMIQHEINPIKSIDTNIIGTSNLVKKCIEYNKKIIYISTDYVYSGSKYKHKETSPVLPTNSYSWSKLGGECAVQISKNFLIIRLAMVEYPFPHEDAFSNVYKSSIWSDEAPSVILKIIDENGIYNVGGEPKSIYEFVKKRYPKIKKRKAEKSVPKKITIDTNKLMKVFG